MNHPLRRLFEELVRRRFRGIDLKDPAVSAYVSGLLTEFVHSSNLFKIQNAKGQPLEDVGEMLLESNPLDRGGSFDRERAVRKHIGDYTLFLAGVFPEYVASRPRYSLRLDAFVDYVRAGKESYRIVSAFDQFEYRDEARLFRQLAESFELCVHGLNLVRQDLDVMQQPNYLQLREIVH